MPGLDTRRGLRTPLLATTVTGIENASAIAWTLGGGGAQKSGLSEAITASASTSGALGEGGGEEATEEDDLPLWEEGTHAETPYLLHAGKKYSVEAGKCVRDYKRFKAKNPVVLMLYDGKKAICDGVFEEGFGYELVQAPGQAQTASTTLLLPRRMWSLLRTVSSSAQTAVPKTKKQD